MREDRIIIDDARRLAAEIERCGHQLPADHVNAAPVRACLLEVAEVASRLLAENAAWCRAVLGILGAENMEHVRASVLRVAKEEAERRKG